TTAGFQSALLVSVPFWQKHGFVEVTNQQANESYGEDAKVMMRAL
ncbi:GNAT family acetyltransferase, partial [Marinomonas sp. BSi20584]